MKKLIIIKLVLIISTSLLSQDKTFKNGKRYNKNSNIIEYETTRDFYNTENCLCHKKTYNKNWRKK